MPDHRLPDDQQTVTTLTTEEREAIFADVPQVPGAPKPDPILVVDNVSRTFGGLKAVDVAHLEIQRGCITGLIGPNGAGKTTLFNLLTGFDRPDSGTWSMDGQSLGRMYPHQVARRGVVRTFQLTKALSKLTVLDNVRLGATGQRGGVDLQKRAPQPPRGAAGAGAGAVAGRVKRIRPKAARTPGLRRCHLRTDSVPFAAADICARGRRPGSGGFR